MSASDAGEPVSEQVLGLKAFFARSKYRVGLIDSSQGGFGRAPLSPSHTIIGRFQRLKSLKHPNLCQYIDIVKGKHDRLFVISEHFTRNLRDKIARSATCSLTEENIKVIAFEILNALVFLNEHSIRHRNVSSSSVLFDGEGHVKLSDYGLYEMTAANSLVAFPVGELNYLAPEDVPDGIAISNVQCSPKSDIWSLGVLIIEMVIGSCPFSHSSSDAKGAYKLLLQIFKFSGLEVSTGLLESKMSDLDSSDLELLRQRECGILGRSSTNGFASPHMNTTSITQIDPSITAKLLYEERERMHQAAAGRHDAELAQWFKHPKFAEVSESLKEIVELCLTVDPVHRVTPLELLSHPYFGEFRGKDAERQLWVPKPFARINLLDRGDHDHWKETLVDQKLRADHAKSQKTDKLAANMASPQNTQGTPPAESTTTSPSMSLSELFHFWKVGSPQGLEHDLAPQLQIAPPVLRLPLLMRSQIMAESDLRLPQQNQGLKDESRKYDPMFVTIPVDHLRHCIVVNAATLGQSSRPVDEAEWSVEEKQKDMAYQRRRVRLFKELLSEYPGSRGRIIKEAHTDIPPVLRGQVWAAVLGLPSHEECKKIYDSIDKDSEGPADRQIELDIPRCHQYHELLSSPLGHRKFKSILKAWVAFNPKLSYWQGIDSLLAPFLSLNFDDEPTAFMCLQHTIEKYSKNLFTKDNSVYFQETLHTFKQLVSYHDPELSMHLHNIGFQPDLYAIPWFLTLFTHDFTIDQIYRLWDRVLVGDSQIAFFLCFAIMEQLRDILLPLDFNACILLFSSLPSINMDRFLQDATAAAQNTPPSVTIPNYVHESHEDSRWWDRRVPLDELQQELFPRISVTDLVSSKFNFVVLDIRSLHEYQESHYPGSNHISPESVSMEELAELSHEAHILIIGERNGSAETFANRLVQHCIPRVSVLNGGFDALVSDAAPLLSKGHVQQPVIS